MYEIDADLRDAIYFEALKANEAEEAAKIADELIAAVLAVLIARGISSFVGMTGKVFSEILKEIRAKIETVVKAGEAATSRRMQTVVAVAIAVGRRIGEIRSGRKLSLDNYTGSAAGAAAVWGKIEKDVVPAVGFTPREMLKSLFGSARDAVVQGAKRAYADNWSIGDYVKYLKGTRERNFKDGVMNKLNNQTKAVIETILSHAKATIAYDIGKYFYPKYQWISILDTATTDICRSRHLKIYEYGKGPRPPAHVRCRSIIVGITGSLANQLPSSYWNWLKSQPAEFLADVLLPADAKAVKDGTAKSKDFSAYRNVKRITPEEYKNKLPTITKGLTDAET